MKPIKQALFGEVYDVAGFPSITLVAFEGLSLINVPTIVDGFAKLYKFCVVVVTKGGTESVKLV